MLILGIDPGTAITGYGLCSVESDKIKVLDYGCIRTTSKENAALRLLKVYETLEQLIREKQPQHLAVEQLFFNKNVRTALIVGQARGVVLLAAAKANIPVWEYTPLQVKQAVTGYGQATKKQVQEMVRLFLNLSELPQPDDIADALAIAICHAHSFVFKMLGRKSEGDRIL